MKRLKIRSLQHGLWLLVVFWMGLACSIAPKPDGDEPAGSTDVPPTEAVANPAPMELTQTYTSSSTGCFAFDYPDGWQLSGTGGEAVWVDEIASAQSPQAQRLGFLPQDGTDIEALAQQNSGTTIQNAIRADVILASGLTGIRLSGTSGDQSMVLLFTVVGNRAIMVMGYADISVFSIIANSLRSTC